MERQVRWPIFVTFLIGAVFLVPAAFLARNTLRFLADARTAPGLVVGAEPSDDGEGSFPVVTFSTPDGKSHRFRGTLNSSLSPPPGQTVEVLYDPADPSRAKIKSFFSLWTGVLAIGGFGVVILGVGLLLLSGVGGGVTAAGPEAPQRRSPGASKACPRCGHAVGSGTLNCPSCFAPTS